MLPFPVYSLRKDHYNIQQNCHLVPFLDMAWTCVLLAAANEKDVDLRFVERLWKLSYVESIPKKINVVERVKLAPPSPHSI